MMTHDEAIAHLYDQLGNGGREYWDRIVGGGYVNGLLTPWCACFSSCMYLDFGVEVAGLPNTCALDASELPSEDVRYGSDIEPLDAINFDWDGDYGADHIGIVGWVFDWGCRCFEGNVGDPSHVAIVDRPWGNILFGVHPRWEEDEVTNEDIEAISERAAQKVIDKLSAEGGNGITLLAGLVWGARNRDLEERDAYQILRDVRTALGIHDGQHYATEEMRAHAISYDQAAIAKIAQKVGA